MRNKSSKDDILLVPSAILVPDELRLDVGSIPSGMVPLKGRPIIDRIAEKYSKYTDNRIVAVNENAEKIHQYINRSDYQWTIIDVGDSESLANTIETSLEQYEVEDLTNQGIYLNFADTLISPVRELKGSDYISYQPKNRAYRWTTFSIKDEKIDTVIEKYDRFGEGLQPAFAGQFGITNATEFYSELAEVTATSNSSLSRFYRALLSYLDGRNYKLVEPDIWLDVGHLDTYYKAKKQFLNTREFNELYVNEKNVITKQSNDSEILINEIRWFTQIPKPLQPYLPRVYDWSTDQANPFIKMEYVGYPSLADLQLYGSHGQHIWNGAFHRLFQMFEEFGKFRAGAAEKEINSALEEIYIKKTRKRFEDLRKDRRFQPYFSEGHVTVNGIEYPSINQILAQLESVVTEAGLLTREELPIIHGDLCLPNVLYDPRNEIIKIVDPRGSFGKFVQYGDPRYDLAKLRHSFVGHYEHLITGQFTTEAKPSEQSLTYDIICTDAQLQREHQFDTLLAERTSESLDSIKLIEALLYLSMVPLHSDNHDRQVTMLAQGIKKVAPYLG